MELKEKDGIGEAVQILNGIRDLCIVFEEGRDIPRSAYIVLITAIERAVGILECAGQVDCDVPFPTSKK